MAKLWQRESTEEGHVAPLEQTFSTAVPNLNGLEIHLILPSESQYSLWCQGGLF